MKKQSGHLFLKQIYEMQRKTIQDKAEFFFPFVSDFRFYAEKNSTRKFFRLQGHQNPIPRKLFCRDKNKLEGKKPFQGKTNLFGSI